MNGTAKLFRGLHVTEEVYFRCNQCGKIVGGLSPVDYGSDPLEDEIDQLIADWFVHQEAVCEWR